MKATQDQKATGGKAMTHAVNYKFYARRYFATGTLVILAAIGSVSFAHRSDSATAAPTTTQSLFADAVSPEPSRLQSARDAAKRGDNAMAFHDYLASIQTEPSSAAIAIAEITNLSVSIADKDGGDERFADQSAQLNECYQTLLRLQQADAGEKNLSEDARVRLFSELKRAHDVCAGIARSQIDAADSLRNDAKGKHWWNRNDRDKEAQALHEVNLAWSYYPSFVDESTVRGARASARARYCRPISDRPGVWRR